MDSIKAIIFGLLVVFALGGLLVWLVLQRHPAWREWLMPIEGQVPGPDPPGDSVAMGSPNEIPGKPFAPWFVGALFAAHFPTAFVWGLGLALGMGVAGLISFPVWLLIFWLLIQ